MLLVERRVERALEIDEQIRALPAVPVVMAWGKTPAEGLETLRSDPVDLILVGLEPGDPFAAGPARPFVPTFGTVPALGVTRAGGEHVVVPLGTSRTGDVPGPGIGSAKLAYALTYRWERKRAALERRLLYRVPLLAEQIDDPRTVLTLTLAELCRCIGWQLGEVWVAAADGRLHQEASWVRSDPALRAFTEASGRHPTGPTECLPGRTRTSAAPLWIPDLDCCAWYRHGALARRVGLRTALGIPIEHHGGAVGALTLFARSRHEHDARLVELVRGTTGRLGAKLVRLGGGQPRE